MITGTVDPRLNAVLSLVIRGASAEPREIETVVDTGFNGFLTLPPALVNELQAARIGLGRAILADGDEKLFPLHEISVTWDGETRTVEATAADATPLIGMAMMQGYDLHIEVESQGRVALRKLTAAES